MRRIGVIAGVVLACVAASSAGAGMRVAAVEGGPVREMARAERVVELEAVVTGEPQATATARRPVFLVRARAEVVQRTRVRVPVLLIAADPRWSGLVPSQRVRSTARLDVPRHGELLAAAAVVRGPPRVLGSPSRAQRAAESVRTKLRQAVERLPDDQRGVLPGMVVGDTSRLDDALAEDFRTAGLSHLLVVSGANLAIVIGAVLAACRFAGLGRRWSPLVAGLAVIGFVLVARPEPSVLRAAVMGTIGLLALLSGRERQGLPALCAAVIVLVLVDPSLARSYGFALSVVATAGLLVLAPPWRERLRRRMPGFLADALAVAAAAQIAVSPLLVTLSGELGLVAILANLLAAPAVAPATLLGALAALVAFVSLPLARLVVWPAGLAVGWIVWIARAAADLPFASVVWPGGAFTLLLTGVAAYAVLRWRPARLVCAALVTGVLVAFVGLRCTAPGWPPRDWMLVACDVGQGDGLVLSVGEGRAVVVDAGPDPGLIDGCLRRLDVRGVAMLVLTHPHADHVDGVAGVRRGRAVDMVLTTPRTSGKETRLLGGLPVQVAGPGQEWTVGELTLSILGPPDGPRLTSDDDGTAINNASIVMVARRPGFSALLAGDVETEAQQSLAPGVPPVQVLKVAHHGSRRQDPAFTLATRAKISIISVGRDNDYGHPSPPTMALLHRLGARVHRTDERGDVAVIRTSRGPATLTRR
ncbi:ComEC/Rec2 family competence protein [Spirillospora sp. NPDC047279]|uniref:ComEC/Rec2 family competence protein n=1 Tax=Spirillospora sp. NPDC047279 TaxID=3155478 RepID=UPI0033DE2143